MSTNRDAVCQQYALVRGSSSFFPCNTTCLNFGHDHRAFQAANASAPKFWHDVFAECEFSSISHSCAWFDNILYLECVSSEATRNQLPFHLYRSTLDWLSKKSESNQQSIIDSCDWVDVCSYFWNSWLHCLHRNSLRSKSHATTATRKSNCQQGHPLSCAMAECNFFKQWQYRPSSASTYSWSKPASFHT